VRCPTAAFSTYCTNKGSGSRSANQWFKPKVIHMTRLSLLLVASVISIPWMAIESSAQTGSQNMEAFCSRHPTHPACSAIMDQYCAQTPNDPACLSDDDEDDEDDSTQ
jgi:hypothetical protein